MTILDMDEQELICELANALETITTVCENYCCPECPMQKFCERVLADRTVDTLRDIICDIWSSNDYTDND